MKFFKKPAFLITSIILVAFFLTFALTTIKKDINYAHTSHGTSQNPFDWFSYQIEHNFNKFVRSLDTDKKIGLPQIHLYISEKKQRSLLKNIPTSTKKWKKGFLLTDAGLKKIELRHRGDNSVNWAFSKKSWKIKIKKREMLDRVRVRTYIAPQDLLYINNYASYNIADRMGVLSPNARLVELFINGESSGIYIELEQLNESFLRRNKIMPVNLYKGEQYNIEQYIGLHDNLFNNPGLWTKVAYFNKTEKEDYSDLNYLLDLTKKSEVDKESMNELFHSLDIETWSNFAAYQILAMNYLNNTRHNVRLALDLWSGEAIPILHDPGSKHGYDNINNDNVLLEKSSHKILSILNRSSIFIDKKYQKLLHYTTENDVLHKESGHICGDDLGADLDISIKRDIHMLPLIQIDVNNVNKRHLLTKSGQRRIRERICDSMISLRDDIINRVKSNPEAAWSYTKSGFEVVVNGETPASNLLISFEKNGPAWVALDINMNGIFDGNDIKFKTNNTNTLIPYSFYANRIRVSNDFKDIDRTSSIEIAPTKFNFIASEKVSIKKITATNIFSKSTYALKNNKIMAVLPNLYNTPISNLNITEQAIEMSGVINIYKDKVIDRPVNIMPGTTIKLAKGASLIFRNKVIAEGENDRPISFQRMNPKDVWGVVAIQGKLANNSILSHLSIDGGSGGLVKNIHYTGMLSLHNVDNVKINNLIMTNNSAYDDMLHIVYADNILLNKVSLHRAVFDAIDIDISSNITMKDLNITNAGNDGIDLMDSSVVILNTTIKGSGDKGISAGENSKALIYHSSLSTNNIGLAAKDGSIVNLELSSLDNNSINIDAYNKNWQYGTIGGTVNIHYSAFTAKENVFNATKTSSINFNNTSCINNNLITKGMLNKENHQYFHQGKILSNLNINSSKTGIGLGNYHNPCNKNK